MDNFLQEYEKLNCDGRKFVDCALKGAISTPAYLKATPKEELLAIQQKNEEIEKKRECEAKERHQYFEGLKAESNNMSKDDYIDRLNELFEKLPTYKLRYFFLIITAQLHYDAKSVVD